jgi:hypothetical protein
VAAGDQIDEDKAEGYDQNGKLDMTNVNPPIDTRQNGDIVLLFDTNRDPNRRHVDALSSEP